MDDVEHGLLGAVLTGLLWKCRLLWFGCMSSAIRVMADR